MLGTVGVGMWLKRILGLALALLLSAGLWLLRPTPADPSALAVLDGSAPVQDAAVEPAAEPSPAPQDPAAEAAPGQEAAAAPEVTITETRTYLEMSVAGSTPTRGFAFFQGGLVDPRAYVKILRPIAAAGYLVSIHKSPFDLPIADIGGMRSTLDRHPEIEWWAVGGHSLGGVAAATFAASSPRTTPALVLWASYPFASLASVDALTVLSVSGTADGLTTPQDIEASKAKLPSTTTFAAVEGAVHSFFGDYGDQRGDGEPTISREDAQQQIVATTLQWLNSAAGVA